MQKQERCLLRGMLAGVAALAIAGCNLFNFGGIWGTVTTLAGDAGYSGSYDATGPSATFSSPKGVATDGTYLYVADTGNNRIRKIQISSGSVTTLASSGLNTPTGIAFDGTTLYVADTGTNTIRTVDLFSGAVLGMAVSGVTFSGPQGITADGAGNLYVADTGNNTIKKVVISTKAGTTLAGSPGSGAGTDGTGTAARFNSPTGITTDGINLYVADKNNHAIRQIVIATGVVTTIAGTGSSGSSDGTGTSASFWYPSGIDTDGVGLIVADTWNDTIRQIVIATKAVTTLAGSASDPSGATDGVGNAARFSDPWGIVYHGTSIYVADSSNHTIRQIK